MTKQVRRHSRTNIASRKAAKPAKDFLPSRLRAFA